jgi:hypothetical protein
MSDDTSAIDFSIRIVNKDGEGIRGISVNVSYYISTDSQNTDEDGWAHFSHFTVAEKLVLGGTEVSEVTVGKRGRVVAEDLWIKNGDSFTYTVSED